MSEKMKAAWRVVHKAMLEARRQPHDENLAAVTKALEDYQLAFLGKAPREAAAA